MKMMLLKTLLLTVALAQETPSPTTGYDDDYIVAEWRNDPGTYATFSWRRFEHWDTVNTSEDDVQDLSYTEVELTGHVKIVAQIARSFNGTLQARQDAVNGDALATQISGSGLNGNADMDCNAGNDVDGLYCTYRYWTEDAATAERTEFALGTESMLLDLLIEGAWQCNGVACYGALGDNTMQYSRKRRDFANGESRMWEGDERRYTVTFQRDDYNVTYAADGTWTENVECTYSTTDGAAGTGGQQATNRRLR